MLVVSRPARNRVQIHIPEGSIGPSCIADPRRAPCSAICRCLWFFGHSSGLAAAAVRAVADPAPASLCCSLSASCASTSAAAPMACCRRLCVARTRMREIVRAGRVWRALSYMYLSKRPRPPLPPLRQPPSPP